MSSNFFKLKAAVKFKEAFELAYWKTTRLFDKEFGNDHYKYFYTEYFGLDDDFYKSKKILDIGCGPRGSLEWANMASERIGLDPLANSYLKMGADQHQMTYVNSYVEDTPFEDNHFDVICSFNSLDHVGDLNKSCEEIKRILKPEGLFLLIVDIHRMPTPTEPQQLKWDFVDQYFGGFDLVEEKHLERNFPGKIYSNLKVGKLKTEPPSGDGILTVVLKKIKA